LEAATASCTFAAATTDSQCRDERGFTIGASTSHLVGHALNLQSPADIQGTYSVIGAGGALAAGAGGVQLQNQRGVVLQLTGGKVGVELSAAVGGVTIALQ
jgi:hypothetical protein